jgi:hypothetical protein
MSRKAHPLDKKLPQCFSLSRRTKIAFEKSCASLGVIPSNIIEGLMKDFINDVNSK